MTLGFGLGAFVLFIAIVSFIYTYSTRVANRAITEQFRAAETLVGGRLPKFWRSRIDRRLTLARVLGPLGGSATGEGLALKRLDELKGFFEHSRFFETEEAREELLRQFQEIRMRWETMDWKEIVESAAIER